MAEPDSDKLDGWRRAGRSATAALLSFLGILLLPVGMVTLAGGGAEAFMTNGREWLLVLALLVVAGAPLLLGAGAAIRPNLQSGRGQR